MISRIHTSHLFSFLAICSGVLCLAILFFLLTVVFWKGLAAIDLDFLLTRTREFGAAGGIFYQILGSLLMMTGAMVVSFSIAFGSAIFLSEYVESIRKKNVFQTLILGLNGVPSIIYGIFGLVFFVHFCGLGISWTTGSLILGIMMIPTIMMAAYQAMQSIPQSYRETALGLGLSRWQTIRAVVIPQSFHGAVTGLLLSLARAIGETAPIMFTATAFSGVLLPHGFSDPVTTLPTHILALVQQATNSAALQNAWGSSLVLITLVFCFSISAFALRQKFSHSSRR